VKNFFVKFPGVSEIFGVKEKPLTSPSGKTGNGGEEPDGGRGLEVYTA